MSDPAFKYTDSSHATVSRAWPDGRVESHSVDAEEVKRWVAEGGVIVDYAPTLQDQINEIDMQMAAVEQAKLLGRTAREGELWGLVKEYIAVGMGANPLLATDAQKAQAIADLSDPKGQYYNAGFVRLKAFDDFFVNLRAQRAELVSKLNG